jgi:hypothetical protein
MAEVEKLLNLELDDPVTTQGLSPFDDTVAEAIVRFDSRAVSDDILDAPHLAGAREMSLCLPDSCSIRMGSPPVSASARALRSAAQMGPGATAQSQAQAGRPQMLHAARG